MVTTSDIDVPYFGKSEVWVDDKDQSVPEIIDSIRKSHKIDCRSYDDFSEKFWQGNARDTADLLFRFCKRNIKYIIESEKGQTVKSPGRILHDKHGDCKHYSLWITGVCDSLNRKGYPIKANYRFVADVPGMEVHHVFSVVHDKDGDYWVDPVINFFNERPTFFNIKDMSISRLSGTDGSGINGTFDTDISMVAGRHKIHFHTPKQIIDILRHYGKDPHHFANVAEMKDFLAHKIANDEALRNHLHSVYDSGLHTHRDGVGKRKHHNNFMKKIAHGFEVNAKNVKHGFEVNAKNLQKDAKHLANEVKNVGLKVSLAAARGPFLSLVDLNTFNWAHRLHDTLLGPHGNELKSKWKDIGGKPQQLVNAVNNGYRQYKIHHGGYNLNKDKIHGTTVVISGVGVIQVAALAALAATIAGILAKFLKPAPGSPHEPEDDKNFVDAVQQGTGHIIKAAYAGYNAMESGAGAAALNDVVDQGNQGSMDLSTGVADDGTPTVTVHAVKHPLLNNAGASPSSISPDDIGGGGDVAQPDGNTTAPNPNDKAVKDTGGGIFDEYVGKAKEFIKAHPGPIIGITVGSIAVYAITRPRTTRKRR